jgi:hypothetical protein
MPKTVKEVMCHMNYEQVLMEQRRNEKEGTGTERTTMG